MIGLWIIFGLIFIQLCSIIITVCIRKWGVYGEY